MDDGFCSDDDFSGVGKSARTYRVGVFDCCLNLRRTCWIDVLLFDRIKNLVPMSKKKSQGYYERGDDLLQFVILPFVNEGATI